MEELSSFSDEILKPVGRINYDLSLFIDIEKTINSLSHEMQFELAKKIKSMEYDDFISSFYWKLLSLHIKKQSLHRCRFCNSNDVLNVHHRSYEHHGYEYQTYKTELVCICEKCQNGLHKEEKNG